MQFDIGDDVVFVDLVVYPYLFNVSQDISKDNEYCNNRVMRRCKVIAKGYPNFHGDKPYVKVEFSTESPYHGNTRDIALVPEDKLVPYEVIK